MEQGFQSKHCLFKFFEHLTVIHTIHTDDAVYYTFLSVIQGTVQHANVYSEIHIQ